MARETPTETKTARKISAKDNALRELINELSVVFSDLTIAEIKTLATMNQIPDLSERGSAIQYFWAAKKLNA